MKPTPFKTDALRGVFAVPPLARKNDAARSIDFAQNELIAHHISAGGISRLIYGGNAFLYHIRLAEFEALVDWLSNLAGGCWIIPSIGPSYGLALEQAAILRRYQFPCAMILPCGDPRDASGLECGYREIAEAANTKLIVYLKDENNFGADKDAGLDAVPRLVDDVVGIGIKYPVVREVQWLRAFLEGLLARSDRSWVISGIG